MVAFLSNIAALEVAAGTINDIHGVNLSKKNIILMLAATECVLILPSAVNPNFIGILDLIFGSGMQTLGSGIAIITLLWFWGRKKTLHQIFRKSEGFWQIMYFYWMKWVVPLALLIILMGYIYNSIT